MQSNNAPCSSDAAADSCPGLGLTSQHNSTTMTPSSALQWT